MVTRPPTRRAVQAGLTLLALLCGADAAAAGGGSDLLGPPSWADSGAAFAPRPVRAEPPRVALTAPRPRPRATSIIPIPVPAPLRRPAFARRTAPVVTLTWAGRGGLAVHPRVTERFETAAAHPVLPPPELPAPTPPTPMPAAATAVAATEPAAAQFAPTPAGSLEAFLRATRPGAWSPAVSRTAAAGGPTVR